MILGNAVLVIHVRPSAQGARLSSTLLLHSQAGGDAVVLQVSEEVPRQSEVVRQEQAGCKGSSVVFKHTRPVSQTVKFGALDEHSHIGGYVVLLHVSEFSRQSDASKQEHAGCPGIAVRSRQALNSSQTSELLLAAHPQLAGVVDVSQVSAVSPRQSETVRHEHAGCPVTFWQSLPASHIVKFGPLVLHSHIGYGW